MLAEGLVRTDVRAGQDGLLQCGQLALQAGGQNRTSSGSIFR